MIIGLASLNQHWEDKIANLVCCENLIKTAKAKQVELMIFPEMTLTGFSMNISKIVEKTNQSPTIASFQLLAQKYCISIIFGVVFEKNSKAENFAIFIDKYGKILAKYQKIHPFSYSGEDLCFNSGKKIVVAPFDAFSIGLTICYDLRFPELYSALSRNSDLIINIANWPAKRVNHWTTLLQARAIENQVFIAGVNRTGVDGNGIEYQKSSIVVGPNGEKTLPSYSEEELDVFSINPQEISEYKSKFSTTQDRRPKFYKSIL